MAGLWWQRERRLYGGKSPDEQRQEVLARAGLSPSVVLDAYRQASLWPPDAHYHIAGGGHNQSYIKYLLIPRIPSGMAENAIAIDDGGVAVTPLRSDRQAVAHPSILPVLGFLLSLGMVAVVAAVLWILASRRLSFPEGIVCACLGVGVLVAALHGRNPPVRWGVVGTAMFVSFLGGAVMAWRRRGGIVAVFKALYAESRPPYVALVGLILAASAVSFAFAVVVVPDDWDAWATWAAKAKVLALGQGNLGDVTHFGWPDYPLLWPSIWAFSGWCSGGWEEQWAKGWGPVFLLLTAWQIGVVVHRSTGARTTALLAGAVFACVPKVIMVASWGYAETLLWLTTVCAFGRMVAFRESTSSADALWAGLFAGAAAMTKNEGILLVAVGGVWLTVVTGVRRWRALIGYGAVALAFVFPWLWWVHGDRGVGSHSTEGLALSTERLGYAGSRLTPALREIAGMWSDWRQWGVAMGLVVAGVVWAAIRSDRWRPLLVLPCCVLCGSFVVILFDPSDVGWLVGSSWDRLTIQVLPLLVIAMTIAGTTAIARTSHQGSVEE
jgi:hypothetical protein